MGIKAYGAEIFGTFILHISGCHLNPAITLGLVLSKNFKAE